MTRLRRSLPFLWISVCALAPVASITEASALIIPTEDTDAPPESSATGGSPGVAEPPPMVYLNRYTYYLGEVITGQLDCPSCYPEGPIFMDQMGTILAGTVVYDETHYGSFVFIPSEPLPVGLYLVQLDFSSTNFEVIEGPATIPTYQAALVEDPHAVGEPLACQSYVPGYEAYAYPQTRIDAALALSIMGESHDQYRYEFTIDGDASRTSTSAGYPLASFREGHGEFCVEVFGIPYNGDSEVSLGTTCMNPDAELDLGVQDLLYGTIESVLRVCELPPDGYTDDWCAYHAEAFTRHSCQGFVEEACVQARYECPEGDLPEWYDANGIDPNDPNAPYNPNDPNRGTGGSSGGTGDGGTGAIGTGATGSGGLDGSDSEDSSGDESGTDVGGCSCKTGPSRGLASENGALLLFGFGGALIALRRRERKLWR